MTFLIRVLLIIEVLLLNMWYWAQQLSATLGFLVLGYAAGVFVCFGILFLADWYSQRKECKRDLYEAAWLRRRQAVAALYERKIERETDDRS